MIEKLLIENVALKDEIKSISKEISVQLSMCALMDIPKEDYSLFNGLIFLNAEQKITHLHYGYTKFKNARYMPDSDTADNFIADNECLYCGNADVLVQLRKKVKLKLGDNKRQISNFARKLHKEKHKTLS